jgi:hypothetical protein
MHGLLILSVQTANKMVVQNKKKYSLLRESVFSSRYLATTLLSGSSISDLRLQSTLLLNVLGLGVSYEIRVV